MNDLTATITSYFWVRQTGNKSRPSAREEPHEAEEGSFVAALHGVGRFSLHTLIGMLLFGTMAALALLVKAFAVWLSSRSVGPLLLPPLMAVLSNVLIALDAVMFLVFMYRSTSDVMSKLR